ncbi:MAG: AsmA-like C-terminal domain-containing protein [Syntrophaceae bacterium]|nr:AsmA-like C-terminal domain-containing protein [Syntrophaceae bacterium]
MARRKKWSFLWILIPILIVGIFALLFIHYLLDPDLHRNAIQESLSKALGREVTIGRARLTFWGLPGIVFEDFRVRDRTGTSDLIQSRRLILKIELLPLLEREVRWKRIILDQPLIRVARDKEKRWNILDIALTKETSKASQQKTIQTISTLFGGSFSLRNGTLSVTDEGLGSSPLTTQIRSFNLHLKEVAFLKPFSFELSGEILHSNREGQVSIAGIIQDLAEDMDLSKVKVEAEVKMKGIETSHFWPYLKTLLPMKMISGSLDLNGHYEGIPVASFKTSAKMRFRDLVYDHPQVFGHPLTPRWVNLDLDMEYDPKEIRVLQLSLELPEISVKARGRIHGIGTEQMAMEAEARTGRFDLSEGKKFIPYRIITPKVSGPLLRAEGKGSIQIVSAKLSGKISEIEHCDQLQYAHTLSAEVRLNRAWVRFPWDLPPLEDLKGSLLFANGHLGLREIEGKFLHSTIHRANGTFQRLLLVPSIQLRGEGRLDLRDLPNLMKIGQSGSSSAILSEMTSLSGAAQYDLSLKGDLKPPLQFQHQGVYRLSKVRLTHSQIPLPILIAEGRINLSGEEIRWSEAKVEFGNSSLLTQGSWNRAGKSGSFEVMTNGKIDLKNVFALWRSPLFPEGWRAKAEAIERLSGTGQFSFKAERPRDRGPLLYQGDWAPKEASLTLKGLSRPIILREGSLSFSHIGLILSKLKVQLGNSSLTLDGFIKEGNLNLSTTGSVDLKYLHALLSSSLAPEGIRSEMEGIQEISGRAEVGVKWSGRGEPWINAIREGRIQLKRVSFQDRRFPVPLSQIEGSLLFSPEEIRLEGWKMRLGDSPLAFSASISRKEQKSRLDKRVSFQLSSSQLNLDPLFPNRKEPTPASFEWIKDLLSHWSFEGIVKIDQGKYHALHYQNTRAEIKAAEDRLFIPAFESKAEGGDIWGEGWIQPAEKGIKFEIKPRVSNVEAKAFLRTFLQKGEDQKVLLSGRLHINKVELQGEGENFQKVKESLNGRLRVEIEKGVIEKFNLLAKIFSILNVSQLFRGRLPDLKTRGLPFRQIVANIDVRDGIASTEDFLVDSDAMRITIFGRADLGKNLIDAKIGVHPLVTIDTVLSKIPIAGYILTGKDKAFISYYYEVKGDLDDPKIEAIPIKGLGENFLGIVKRLLLTPLRPFQNLPSP